jgi:hypothetical protein
MAQINRWALVSYQQNEKAQYPEQPILEHL